MLSFPQRYHNPKHKASGALRKAQCPVDAAVVSRFAIGSRCWNLHEEGFSVYLSDGVEDVVRVDVPT
jgi:hypothetical protein